MSVTVIVPKAVRCYRTTSYSSSLIGFLTILPLPAEYKGESLASAMSDEGGTSQLEFPQQLRDLSGIPVVSAPSVGLLGIVAAACVSSDSGSVCWTMFL